MAEWRHALLRQLGYKPTTENLTFLATWQRWEGGHTNNSARWNWLNTTQDAPGAVGSINSVGVKQFKNFKYGIQATAATLMNGNYQGILRGLASGNPYKAQGVGRGLETWVAGPNGSNPRYAERILGQSAAPPLVTRAKAASRTLKTTFKQMPQRGPTDWDVAMKLIFDDDFEMMQIMSSLDDKVARESGFVSKGGSIKHPTGVVAPGAMKNVVKIAGTQIGKPYVFGSGPDTSSFDCSDLVQWAYAKMGIKIPRTTFDQIHAGKAVNPRGKLMPGDLVFPSNHHVVMYVGNGKVIAAPHTGTVVQYQDLSSFGDLLAVRRIL